MRILVASTAFPGASRLLGEQLPEDEIVVGVARAEGQFEVIVPLMTAVDATMMDRFAPRLIQQYGVGLEGVDREAARLRGIAVANVPADGTGNSDGVAEIAVYHLLTLSRRLNDGAAVIAARGLGEPSGHALHGATIVLLGLGAIGRATARRLRGFDTRLIGVGTRTGPAADAIAAELGLSAYVTADRLHEVLAGARALIVCCPLNARTRGLVGAGALAALGQLGPAYLINVARGPVVDYDALLAALRDGRLAGAGLDVFWDEPIDPRDPLLGQNVTVTPHVGGVTEQSYVVMARRVVANIEALRRGEPIPEA